MRHLAIVLVVAACSSDGKTEVPPGYVPLVTGDWTMQPGSEGYWCVRATATEDIYIKSFKPIAPIGTHHTALALASTPGSDGAYPCKASDAGFKQLFGSGLGTEPFSLPDGVAFKLPAGEQVTLNLHLYNTSDAPLTGTSGIEIERVAPEDVVHEAESIYAINFNVTVPPGSSTTTGRCTLDADGTIFGVFPHMHRLGSHMKGVAVHGEQETLLHDAAYNFETQLNYAIEPVQMSRGDSIRYECGYTNTTGQTVRFGDSSDDEMCVMGVYRYPATGEVSLCVDGG